MRITVKELADLIRSIVREELSRGVPAGERRVRVPVAPRRITGPDLPTTRAAIPMHDGPRIPDDDWARVPKSCPKCNLGGFVLPDFGIKIVGGKTRAQSWCRDCRKSTSYYKPR